MQHNWQYVPELDCFKNPTLNRKLLWDAVSGVRVSSFSQDVGLRFTRKQFLSLPIIEFSSIQLKKSLKEELEEYNPGSILQQALISSLRYELEMAAGKAFQGPHPGVWRMPGELTYSLVKKASYYLHAYFKVEAPHIGLAGYADIIRLKKTSPPWEPWHSYLQVGDRMYKNEQGRTGPVRWVGVTAWDAMGWPPVIFGDKAVARIEAETPMLYASRDFKTVFFKGLLAFANAWRISREVRIIKLG